MVTNLTTLAEVSVPKKTQTYTPVSHMELITCVKEQVDKAGLKIKDEQYFENRGGRQMFGSIIIDGGNKEQDLNIGFRNSYDKSMQLGFVAGARVIVCSNMMFSGEFKSLHMHQGEIAAELDKLAETAVKSLSAQFKQIQSDTKKLKAKKIDQAIINELIGGLFLEQELISVTQLKLIREELKEQKLFGAETVWDIYNHTTEALKTSPVTKIVNDHLKAHEYYMSKC